MMDLNFVPKDDKTAIFLILDGLTKKGYKVTRVIQDTYGYSDDDPYTYEVVSDPERATLAVCEVDEAVVWVDTPEGKSSFIYFVLGNEPYEVACDYGVTLDPDLSNITKGWD